ncbi:hypothetical protein BDQ17DRAFT_1432012 [Cyathus striatus]|nr:hypothetical protein BDQ17DRAFT_1432012 [Cyathus striatus]
MLRFGSIYLATVLAIVPQAVFAAQPLWAQCGGNSWTGDVTCVSGATCTVQNDWYSQCLPGAASSSTAVPSSTAASSAPVSTPTSVAKGNYWFSFGDSYTQTGFDPTSTLPSVSNPFGNPPYPGYTATGGQNWVGYVTTEFNKSLLLTYNYAYGGATIDASLVAPYESTVLSLTDQVNQFLTGAAKKPASTPWTSANSLFSVFIGINDIGNSWYESGDRAAAVGARNFLFVNVPPVDRSPLMLAQSTSDQAAEKVVIDGFNTKLLAKVAGLKANHSDVTTFVWDSNAQFTKMLNNPTAYGFADATTFGSDPTDFWGNNLHPSSNAHAFFGQEVGQDVLGNTIW